MANTQMLIRLRELHEELASINNDLDTTEQIDDATIDALGQLATDVSGLVDKSKVAASNVEPDVSDRHDMLDRIMQFEAQHPRVVRFLSQMTDLLALMGI